MKMIKHLILLIVCHLQLVVYAQKNQSFTVLINNKDCFVEPKNKNVKSIPRHIIGIIPQDVRVNKKGATWAIFQPVHYYYAKNEWYSIENNFLFTPFDFRSTDTDKEQYNFYRMELKSTSSFFFFKKDKLKSSILNIKDNSGGIHELKFKWPSTIRYAARVGAEYQQYSMKEMKTENLVIDNSIISRSTELMGQKQLVLSAGISRQQVKGLSCSFCELGSYNSFNIREIYIDGLIAPLQQLYGSVTDSSANNLTLISHEMKRITDFDYKMIRFGGRVGFRRLGVWSRLPQVLMSLGGEVGWFTGPSVYNFEVSLKIGFYLRRIKN